MYAYNDELRLAAEQIARQKHLKRVQSELLEQREELSQRVGEAKRQMEAEKADVNKLEGRTLTAFFASVIGNKEEKLQKERSEAYAAIARYESLCYELDSVKCKINEIRKELAELSGCESRYKKIYENRLADLKKSNSPDADKILELEKNMSSIKARRKEIFEALTEGKKAYELAEEALRHLNSAKNWNTFDLIGGGGMFTHFEKHGHLDSAQSAVEYLQAQLNTFKAELADVEIRADMDVRIEGFLRFADYFFDGIFADLAVGDRINEGIDRIKDTKNQIARAVDKLEDMLKSTEKQERAVSDKIRDIVENSCGNTL